MTAAPSSATLLQSRQRQTTAQTVQRNAVVENVHVEWWKHAKFLTIVVDESSQVASQELEPDSALPVGQAVHDDVDDTVRTVDGNEAQHWIYEFRKRLISRLDDSRGSG